MSDGICTYEKPTSFLYKIWMFTIFVQQSSSQICWVVSVNFQFSNYWYLTVLPNICFQFTNYFFLCQIYVLFLAGFVQICEICLLHVYIDMQKALALAKAAHALPLQYLTSHICAYKLLYTLWLFTKKILQGFSLMYQLFIYNVVLVPTWKQLNFG